VPIFKIFEKNLIFPLFNQEINNFYEFKDQIKTFLVFFVLFTMFAVEKSNFNKKFD
jgi:hypothetical protein